MGRIYLIRHGQTDSNSGKMFQGQMNTPLNINGLDQAKQMAEYMKGIHLDAIYSSSLMRARMTAAPLAMAKNMAYRPMDLLMETNFGDWEGVSFKQLHQEHPVEMMTFLEKPGDFVPPHGEGFAHAQKRVIQGVEQILAKEGHDKDIAIVAHGGVIRLMLCYFLDIPLNSLWKMAIRNVSVSTVYDSQGYFMVESVNDDHFLKQVTSQGYISIV